MIIATLRREREQERERERANKNKAGQSKSVTVRLALAGEGTAGRRFLAAVAARRGQATRIVTGQEEAEILERFATKSAQQALVVAQAAVRRRAAVREAARRRRAVAKRRPILAELITTELSFLCQLATLERRLAAGPPPGVSSTDWDRVGASLPAVLDVVTRLLACLLPLVATEAGTAAPQSSWFAQPSAGGVGEAFVSLSPSFSAYARYCESYEDGAAILARLTAEPAVAAWLTAQEAPPLAPSLPDYLQSRPSSQPLPSPLTWTSFSSTLPSPIAWSPLPLSSLLVAPVQRMPRYRMLLADSAKNTWADHRDAAPLAQSLSLVSAAADAANKYVREVGGRAKVAALARELGAREWTRAVREREREAALAAEGGDGARLPVAALVPLASLPARLHLRTGPLRLTAMGERERERDVVGHLLTDVLVLVTTAGEGGDKDREREADTPADTADAGTADGDDRDRATKEADAARPRIVDLIWLSTLRGLHDLPDLAGLKCAFRMVGGEGGVRHLSAPSKALKAGWLTDLRTAISNDAAIEQVAAEATDATAAASDGARSGYSGRGSLAASVGGASVSTDGSTAVSRSGTDASETASWSLSASGNRPVSPVLRSAPSSAGMPRRSALGAAAGALSMPVGGPLSSRTLSRSGPASSHQSGSLGSASGTSGEGGGSSEAGGAVPSLGLSLADRLADSWSVTLEGTEVRGVGKKQHAVYIVKLKASSGNVHKVFRRYSEFDTLHGLLRKSHAHCAARLPALPRKTFIASAMSGRVLESRQVALDSYLQALVANRDTVQLPLVRAFLELPGEDQGGWDSSFGMTPRGAGSSGGSSITTPRAILTNLRPGGGRPSSPASPPSSTAGSSITLRGKRGGGGGGGGAAALVTAAAVPVGQPSPRVHLRASTCPARREASCSRCCCGTTVSRRWWRRHARRLLP